MLLTTIDSNNVDAYIDYNLKYANATNLVKEKIECANNVLKVNEGNVNALNVFLYAQLENNENSKEVIKTFEEVLKYSKDNRGEVVKILSWLEQNLNSFDDCNLAGEVLRYTNDSIETFKDLLIKLSSKMIENHCYEKAEYFCKIVLNFDESNPLVYWNICLIKVRASKEEYIKNSITPLKLVPEYTKYLTLVDKKRRLQCIELEQEQEKCMQAKAEVENYKKYLEKYPIMKKEMEIKVKYEEFSKKNKEYNSAKSSLDKGAMMGMATICLAFVFCGIGCFTINEIGILLGLIPITIAAGIFHLNIMLPLKEVKAKRIDKDDQARVQRDYEILMNTPKYDKNKKY